MHTHLSGYLPNCLIIFALQPPPLVTLPNVVSPRACFAFALLAYSSRRRKLEGYRVSSFFLLRREVSGASECAQTVIFFLIYHVFAKMSIELVCLTNSQLTCFSYYYTDFNTLTHLWQMMRILNKCIEFWQVMLYFICIRIAYEALYGKKKPSAMNSKKQIDLLPIGYVRDRGSS